MRCAELTLCSRLRKETTADKQVGNTNERDAAQCQEQENTITNDATFRASVNAVCLCIAAKAAAVIRRKYYERALVIFAFYPK